MVRGEHAHGGTMIKPSEVSYSRKTDATENLSAECEAQFDEYIRKAESSGKWPAIVPGYRDGMPAVIVEQTAARYRAEGWTVDTNVRERASISPPVGHPCHPDSVS